MHVNQEAPVKVWRLECPSLLPLSWILGFSLSTAVFVACPCMFLPPMHLGAVTGIANLFGASLMCVCRFREGRWHLTKDRDQTAQGPQAHFSEWPVRFPHTVAGGRDVLNETRSAGFKGYSLLWEPVTWKRQTRGRDKREKYIAEAWRCGVPSESTHATVSYYTRSADKPL